MPGFKRSLHYKSKKGNMKKRNFKSKASYKAKKFKIGLRRKTGGMSLTKIIASPCHFTKLTWMHQIDATVDISSSSAFVVYPMSSCPASGTRGTFLAATNVIYTGISQYAQYFSYMRVHAAKISYRIQMQPLVGGAVTVATPYLNCVLVALPYSVDSQIPPNAEAGIAALTYEQLASYPTAKRAQLTQGNKAVHLSKFVSTKKIFNYTSIRDNPNNANLISTTLAHGSWAAPANQYYVLLSMQNTSGETAYVNVECRIQAWCELFGNNFSYEQVLT